MSLHSGQLGVCWLQKQKSGCKSKKQKNKKQKGRLVSCPPPKGSEFPPTKDERILFMKKLISILIAVVLCAAFCAPASAKNFEDTQTTVKILFIDDSVIVTQGARTFQKSEYETYKISFEDGVLTLNNEATYTLSGELNGQVVIKADNAEVTVILDGLNLTCEDGEALEIKQASKINLVLAEGSENVITSGFVPEDTEEEAEEADSDEAAEAEAADAADAEETEEAADQKAGAAEAADDADETAEAADAADAEETEAEDTETAAVDADDADEEVEAAEAGDDEAAADDETAEADAEAADDAGEAEAAAAAEAKAADLAKAASLLSKFSGEPTDDENTEDNAEELTEPAGAAVHLKADAAISGEGSLSVNGYINNGITCTGDLTIESGNISIYAVNHGIKEKQTLNINGGELYIRSVKDGIHAERQAVTAEEIDALLLDPETAAEAVDMVPVEAAGIVNINGGSITIEPEADGIQAMMGFTMAGGTLKINTQASSLYDYSTAAGKRTLNAMSRKGIKSDKTLTIDGGTYSAATAQDPLHSAETLTINDGFLSLSTYDDGIHSDTELVINGGIINIGYSYEGLEANQITINDGTITLKAEDDGMNANGGFGSFGGPGGRSSSGNTNMPNLTINGGDIFVNAYGDGLDSNGNLTIAGGKVVVEGPVDSWNGPLDSGMENGGQLICNGGTVWASGASGMAESFSTKSGQNSFHLQTNYKAGDSISITDENGTELFSITTIKQGSSIVFSSPELELEHTYYVHINDKTYALTLTKVSQTYSGRSVLVEEETEEAVEN